MSIVTVLIIFKFVGRMFLVGGIVCVAFVVLSLLDGEGTKRIRHPRVDNSKLG